MLVRYLDGELSAAEEAELEGRLRTDKGLQEQLANLRVAVQAVRHFGTAQQVSGIHAEMMRELRRQEKRVVPLQKFIRYALAVAATAAVLFVGVRLIQTSQLSPQGIYADTFVDFSPSTTRGAGDNVSAIEKHYAANDHEAVIAAPRSVNLSAKDSLLLGLSYLQTTRHTQAIGIFQRLAATANDYRPDAEFYLSLSYLKNGEPKRALPLLRKINGDALHLYHERVPDETVEKVKRLSEE